MNPIIKTAVVILRDKKILLVTGNDQPFFWTPGGKVDPGETYEETVDRELKEELCVEAKNIRPYFTYLSLEEEDGKPREVHCYFAGYDGELHCSNEVQRCEWVSRGEIEKGAITLQLGIKNHLLPRLIQDGLI